MRTSLVAVGLVVGTVVIGSAGCGGGSSSASLDCAYLASDNCWKTTAASAASCLPADSETGVLSADGSTCTYASGDVVTFTPPVLPLSTSATMTWNFTVTTGSGAQCLSYKDDGNGNLTLNVQGQTVKQTAPGLGIALTCPDGTTHSNSNGLSLLSCPDASFFSSLPGAGWSSSTNSIGATVSLSLTGVAASDGSQQVFNCQTMP